MPAAATAAATETRWLAPGSSRCRLCLPGYDCGRDTSSNSCTRDLVKELRGTLGPLSVCGRTAEAPARKAYPPVAIAGAPTLHARHAQLVRRPADARKKARKQSTLTSPEAWVEKAGGRSESTRGQLVRGDFLALGDFGA